MYHFITQKEYFSALDDPEIDTALATTRHFGIKHAQDAVILNQIRDLPAGRVAEIGGGDSRTLPFLDAKGWSCTNVDRFQGAGNGPVKAPEKAPYSIVDSYIGDFNPSLESQGFDLVYSISVIEHIPDQGLGSFFADNWRILKKGGLSLHAIDMTIGDEEDEAVYQRICKMRQTAELLGFTLQVAEENPHAHYRCEYVTNPELVIRGWGSLAPSMKEQWLHSRVCSLLLILNKRN